MQQTLYISLWYISCIFNLFALHRDTLIQSDSRLLFGEGACVYVLLLRNNLFVCVCVCYICLAGLHLTENCHK